MLPPEGAAFQEWLVSRGFKRDAATMADIRAKGLAHPPFWNVKRLIVLWSRYEHDTTKQTQIQKEA